MTAPPAPAALTPRDNTILALIPLCTKNVAALQFDWAALAQRLGFANPRPAANTWLFIRKKIHAAAAAAGSNDQPINLNQREQRFLANAVVCTKHPLDVDYAALARRLRMTTCAARVTPGGRCGRRSR